jgi:vacuolar-type H+-ATPase subunit I/STV1
VQAKIDSLLQDKQRLEKLKESLTKSIDETTQEIKAKDQKVKELMHKRTQKLIELDKVKGKLEAKEKELRELIKEITKYDEDFHSGMLASKTLIVYLEIGSVLNESSIIHNESVLQELSVLDPKYREGQNRTIIGNFNNNQQQNDDNGFDFGGNGVEGQLDAHQQPSRVGRKTYSKSVFGRE